MERVMQIVEVQPGLFGGWSITVRWRWESGETGKDVYEDLTEDEARDILEAVGVALRV